MNSAKMLWLIFVLVCFEFITHTSSGPVTYPSCRSTDQCVLLRDCNSYMVFINSLTKPLKPPVVQFLREKQCGFEEGYPKVCCSDSPKDIATKSTNMTCNAENECVGLKNCKPYMDIIEKMKKPLNPEFVKFLRGQQCGFKEGYPMVCCSAPPDTFKDLSGQNPTPEDRNKLSMEFDFDDSLNKVKTNTKSSSSGTKRKMRKRVDKDIMSDFFIMPSLFDLFRRRRSSGDTEYTKIK